MKYKRRRFDDSILYNMNDTINNKKLTDFIMKSQRIDKSHPAFKSISEDVKRYQTSTVLYQILLMDDVVLCINNIEMPKAFKVFAAKDLRMDSKTKVFIDVTGLIDYKNNYFTCKKIDVFITYLFSALSYLLYEKEPLKLLSNSTTTITGCECFVALFDYVLDYLRVTGYSTNKDKITYFVALYFLHTIMGKDIDSYATNIAAKIANIPTTNVRALSLYIEDDSIFTDIITFIEFLVNTFKLSDLTSEVFINRWLYHIGGGTQYALELFCPFSNLITSAYCGSYIINQKQVERACGTSMVKYSTSMIKLGADVFEHKKFIHNEAMKGNNDIL